MSEPQWPMGDPATLKWWLEEGGAQDLGRDTNKWLGVIFYCSQEIRTAPSAYERRAFRDVALAATEKAWRYGGIPRDLYAEKQIYARMVYLLNSEESHEWCRDEMARVLDIFLESLPMSFESAQDMAWNWREQPVRIIRSLREIKGNIRLMEPGFRYLSDDKRKAFEGWQGLSLHLP